jgi:hypothetical protein
MRAFVIPAILFTCAGARAQALPDVRLTNDAAFSATTFNNARTVAASGATVHVVWFDTRDGNREIYYKRSTDGGLTFGADVRLTANAAVSHFPGIATSQSGVHVVWEEYRDGNAEIYVKRSIDGGATFGPDVRLTSNAASSFSPSVAASGSAVHVIWYDTRDGNSEIYTKRSEDGGASFGPDTRLTNQAAASVFGGVAAAGSTVVVAWEEYRDGPNGEIYFKRSVDAGASWSADTRLTNQASRSSSPSISASGSNVHVVWFDERDGNAEIYAKRSIDGGASFGADVRLTSDPAVSEYPCVLVSGPNVHVVWMDDRDGNTEIYAKRSTDGGTTWSGDARLTSDTARSTDPSVAATGAVLHVVWTDARDAGVPYDGNYEIYYERNPSANATSTGAQFCAGDGAPPSAPCPCGNTGASGNGCASSVNAAGANLAADGVPSLASDSVTLIATGTPNASVLFFQGTQRVNGGAGVVFGDGLRCVAGTVTRLRTLLPSAGESHVPGPLDLPLSALGAVVAPGELHYQAWYRNAADFCTASTFNLTNGLSVTWTL